MGGQGCDTLTYILAVEEISKVCATTGVILSAHTSLATDAINIYGTEQQKEQFLRPLAEGRKLGSFALTEPEQVQTLPVNNPKPCWMVMSGF